MIYTTYQTNSFWIIKSTFNTYELPHAPVIFSINFGIFNCFEIPTEPKISDKLCRFTEGGGGGAVAPLPHLNFRHGTEILMQCTSVCIQGYNMATLYILDNNS